MPMLSAAAIFGTSFLVGLSGAMSPGPLLAFNIKETVRMGFLAGPLVAAGHSLLELFMVLALAMGITRLLDSAPLVGAIGILGGLFLLWMGWGLLRNPGQAALPSREDQRHHGRSGVCGPLVGGFVVSLSNPFWAVWWLTVGATFMTRSLELGLLGIGAFYVGHILSDFAWYGLVSATLASGRRFITQRLYRGVMLACGVFLAGMGAYFVASGASMLR